MGVAGGPTRAVCGRTGVVTTVRDISTEQGEGTSSAPLTDLSVIAEFNTVLQEKKRPGKFILFIKHF